MNEGTEPTSQGSVLSLPKGGGAVSGLGEKFAPDLFTGTGNLSVPIALPAGRGAASPRLSLGYSSGQGNGPFGLGWQLSLPGVSRRTARGVPRYDDDDVFMLSGAEDLVPVSDVLYRPRTEGLFARIEHLRDGVADYWRVSSTDGLVTKYGTAPLAGGQPSPVDPARMVDPADPSRVFAWRITETADPLGNLVRYEYLRDQGVEPGHTWDQPLIRRVSYADHGDRTAPAFLVTVDFEYEQRPDPFSDYRAGFEVRTTLRCRMIRVTTHATDGVDRVVREYRLSYRQANFTGVSLLSRVDEVGIDGGTEEFLPPLSFTYSGFDPAGRRLRPVRGPGLPTSGWQDPALSLVDTRGAGLPDLVELGDTRRVWHNAGDGAFERPRPMPEAPPMSLRGGGAQFLDADGDGRPDLVVASPGAAAGYYPMSFADGWSRRSFQPYRSSPAVRLTDPSVRLADLDGDGLTDILRSGTRLQAWFNDRDARRAWQRNAQSAGPRVNLADPRVRLADMTGDGLPDLVLVGSGNLTYWPNQGHGRWGGPVRMTGAPRFPDDYDPRRVLLGDVDGDGVADLVYADTRRVMVWANQSGNGFADTPVTITGTPGTVGGDGLQLVDLYGTGMAGLLLSRAADGSARANVWFLDLTGGVKPHLLTGIDNHLGAVTEIVYAPSTAEFLRDEARPQTRWRTTLPFPVQVVTEVRSRDAVSGGLLTTRYRYRHGYWDGVEREFRGFAMVEQFDDQDFDGLEHTTPPTLTRRWFHPGPVAAAEAGDWTELDLSAEYSPADPPLLSRGAAQRAFLAGLPSRDRRDALRALRGHLLRSELYGFDGSAYEARPYTVTETLLELREEAPPGGDDRQRVFFPFPVAERTTQWERGTEPMTTFTFHGGYDAYGFAGSTATIGVPRGRDPLATGSPGAQPYLATYRTTEFARRDDASRYLADRVSQTTTYEIVNDGGPTAAGLWAQVVNGLVAPTALAVRGRTRTYYDGDAFIGLPLGRLGDHGLETRSQRLVATDAFVTDVGLPPYLDPAHPAVPVDYPPAFGASLAPLAGYTHDGDAIVSGYYVDHLRRRYDVHDAALVPRGLLVATEDPFGARTTIAYDAADLLPVRVTDPAGLVTTAINDERLLRPARLTDVNGNAIEVTYSPAGLVTARYARSKDGDGDDAAPSVRMEYDLLAFPERGEPASVRTTRRVHHDTATDVPAADRDQVIVSVQYSDGFGRLVQTRTQAEDTLFGTDPFGGDVLPADQAVQPGDTTGRTRTGNDPDNVVVSDWTRYDNGGRPVVTYEPFYGTGYGFAPPAEAELGQPRTRFYDPRGHVIRTVAPDGSEQRLVQGIPGDLTDPDGYTPTPWETYTYDANDNAGRTHPDASAGYSDHWNTPSNVEVDPFGRVVRAVVRNGPPEQAATAWFTTRTSYDILGHVTSVTDALGRVAFRYTVDLAGRRWRTDGIDAGRLDAVPDAGGAPVETRDARGARTLHAYDPLHRPALAWASDGAASPLTLRERIAYGDGGRPDQAASERDVARAANLLGRVCRTYDESGVLAVDGTDFKGNVRQTTRRVVADAPILETYTAAAGSGWAMTPFTMDWTPGPGQTQDQRDAQLLEPTGYVTSTAYDALNRVTLHTLPSDVDGRRRLLRPSYNRAGALDSLLLDDTVYVAKAGYNAQGQRTVLAYGNGVLTRCAYDPLTYRLTRLRTEPYTVTGTGAYHPAGPVLQDCGYAYDLVGNPVALRDRTPGSGIPGNPAATAITDPVLRALIAGGDALDRSMRYDPAYRLLSATGREFQAPPPGAGWSDQPRGADLSGTQPYQERYSYDAVGGLRQLVHTSTGGFTRDFASADGTNRLTGLTIGATGYDYTTDAAGNITAETTSRHFTWNHAGRLSTFATQTPGAEPSVHAHYLYDATGRRVKKLVRRQGGAVEVTVYVHEDFEHHRWSGSSDGQNTVVHVRDDRRRVALVRIGPAHPDDRGPAVAVHLSDHLGSSVAVLDGTGALTSREEYSPYGETTFGSFTRKRYRFTGMERDGESGLGYHGARYLASWLGRWLSADPDGAGAGLHAFAYVSGNPMRLVDPTGHDGEPFPIGDDIKLGYKGKVWSKALHDDEPIVNPDGTELGKVSVLKVGVKANPKDLGVEGSLAVLDAEVKSPGAVGMVVSGAAAKAKIGVSKNGVAISLTAFEAGVGVAAGPVKAKVLFGAALGWQANWQTLKFEAKVAFPIGGELEVDVPAAGNAVWHTATHLAAGLRPPQPLPDLDLPSEPESVLQRIQEVAHETLPPAPAPPKPRAHRPPPKPASHGCESGADWPGRGGTAYVGGVRR